MSKLWVVTVSTDLVVLADNGRAATATAVEAAREEPPDRHTLYALTPGCALPPSWTERCIPYGETGDRTIGEIRGEALVCSTCNGSGYVEERVTGCTCGGVDIGVGVMHEPGCGILGHDCTDCEDIDKEPT